MGRRINEIQPMVISHAIIIEMYNSRLYIATAPALTGGGGFDECHAPFADTPSPDTLLERAATPDKPLPSPTLGSIS